MPDRENILHKVRAALGRHGGQPPEPLPPPRLVIPSGSREERVQLLLKNFPGEAFHAKSADEARGFVASKITGRTAVASNNPLLEALGIASLPEVTSGITEAERMQEVCAASEFGLTGADYALADPGALVLLSTAREERLASLLPAAHIPVIPEDRILSGLDELFTLLPDPAAESSSMVLIAGPSRTGDIEMTLTLGVHGPKEIFLVVVPS